MLINFFSLLVLIHHQLQHIPFLICFSVWKIRTFLDLLLMVQNLILYQLTFFLIMLISAFIFFNFSILFSNLIYIINQEFLFIYQPIYQYLLLLIQFISFHFLLQFNLLHQYLQTHLHHFLYLVVLLTFFVLIKNV